MNVFETDSQSVVELLWGKLYLLLFLLNALPDRLIFLKSRHADTKYGQSKEIYVKSLTMLHLL